MGALEQRAQRHAALGDPIRLAIVDELTGSDRSPVELRSLAGIESNLLAHHLDVLEQVGLVTRSRSSGDGRRRYVHLHRDLLDDLIPGRRLRPQPALFVCTHNSARSQLAAALWRQLVGEQAASAGTHPAARVHPGALAAARRAGLDLTDAHPQPLGEVSNPPPLVVTVCDRAHEELDARSVLVPLVGPRPRPHADQDRLRRHRRRAAGPHQLLGRLVSKLARQPETGTGGLQLDLARRLVAEALGTGLLVVAVIGSGIMASRLSPDDVGLELLENAAATAGALVGLIWMLGAVSGAHFNPVVTLIDRTFGAIGSRDTGLYIAAQIVGGCLGAIVANLMF